MRVCTAPRAAPICPRSFQQAGLGIVDILGSQTAHKGGTLAEVHDQILHLVQQALKLRSVQLRDEAFHPLSQPR